MTLDKTKEHWRVIDTDFIQFLIERAEEEKVFVVWVWFQIQKDNFVVAFDYDNRIERDNVYENIDADDCMNLYNIEKAKLN